MVDHWFEVVHLWESLDLAIGNRQWICLTGVSLFLWHEDFFAKLGLELGKLVKITSQIIVRSNLREA